MAVTAAITVFYHERSWSKVVDEQDKEALLMENKAEVFK